MSTFDAIILGLVQGLTEFLPVSSKAHLAILEHFWKLPLATRLPLTTMLHVGTAVAMIVYFGPRLVRIAAGCFAHEPQGRGENWRLVGFIALGTAPVAVAGVLLQHQVDAVFASPVVGGAMLIVTGLLLFGTRFAKDESRPLGWGRVLIIGVAQVAALLPGISRSGVTISTATYLGLKRDVAFEFSFLMAIPAILGAAAVELRNTDLSVLHPSSIAIGMAVSFVSGLAALWLLRRAVAGRKLYVFAFYCWLAGLGVLAFVR